MGFQQAIEKVRILASVALFQNTPAAIAGVVLALLPESHNR
jgi:hypothetical protein